MSRWALLLLAIGCSSNSSPAGEPLISGTVQGSYDGNAFTPAFGFATMYQGQGLIGLADGPIHCGSEKMANPPSGSGIIIALPPLATGTYSSAFVQIFRNVGGYQAAGSTGTVTLTAVASSVAGSVDFSFTDTSNATYSATGTFEVVNCMP